MMKLIIDAFIKDRHIAIAGVSRNPSKWGNSLMKELIKLGYSVYPVNPNMVDVMGLKCYATVDQLPEHVQGIIFATNPTTTELIAAQIHKSPLKRVWIHRGAGKGAYSAHAYELLKMHGIEVVYGLCPMMFFNGKGIHKFHFKLKSIFGNVPEGVN